MPATELTRSTSEGPRDAAEATICALLRNEETVIEDPQGFVDLAVSEAVAPLLWKAGRLPPWKSAPGEVLQHEVRRQLALATVREPELRRILTALSEADVDALLVKGAHLAYAFYAQPALRPRHDTDLLIRPGHVRRAHRTLEALGYRHQPAITGEAVQGQAIFEHESLPGAVLDVHARLAAPIVAAELFDFEDLWRRAVAIPILGPNARGPHLHDAIAIAAVHLLAHHPNERALLWLYDLHVLTSVLEPHEVNAVVSGARLRRMTSVLAAALAKANARFPTPAAAAILMALERDGSEPSAALLGAQDAPGRALLDVRALRTWRARRDYVGGHLFPPADYMRRRYAPGSRAPLAWLYAARILRGGRKWLRGS